MTDRYFSDEELVAYLDNETELAPIEEIADALTRDEALSRRLDALRIDANEIASGFKHLATPELPDHFLKVANDNKLRWKSVAAAAVLALGIGYTAGNFNQPAPAKGWKAYVAAYQALYTNSTLAHLETDEADRKLELARVSAAIGKDIQIDKLNISPEINYKRAQVLGFKGKALVQLAFLTSTGSPMALCIIRSNKKPGEDIQTAMLEGMSSASWSQGDYNYLLIGGNDQPLVSRLAKTLKNANL